MKGKLVDRNGISLYNLGSQLQPWVYFVHGLASVFRLMVSVP